jgi:Nucleotidyl transferase AbiEii toxin, Type IV TA system
MPITAFQREVLRLIAANRNPDSFIAGGTVINRRPDSPRTSRDIDLFHDAQESLRLSFQRDAEVLSAAGLRLTVLVDQPSFVRAVVAHGSDQVRLEWVLDSTFRFFPVQEDEEFGYVLHLLDLATNKVLALAGRFEARDFIDAIYFERQGIALGLLAWAAAGKDPGLTPTLILENCRRFSRMERGQFANVLGTPELDYISLREDWFSILDRAQTLVDSLPAGEIGCLYLDSAGELVDPRSHPQAVRHLGSVGGTWPRLADSPGSLNPRQADAARSAILEHYRQPPPTRTYRPPSRPGPDR